MSLPAALQPLAAYPQFISYELRPSQRAGKMDKIPTDWRTGKAHDAHDPSIWTNYDTAYACSGGHAGFVFTDADPFWFLDVDNCLLPDNTWSPLALELCALLPGAAVEVSISGKGLHLFGTGHIPRHTCKNADLGIELYHTGRFVALGGLSGVTGNAATDCTAGLAVVVDRYFSRAQPAEPSAPAAAWTDTPCAEWVGPVDDDDLIRRMCRSKSASGAFGTRASAGQLWEADPQALKLAYPDAGAERGYDASSADAALAQHLAFWTGRDCARIQRLMLRSKLARDKWDREDYLPRTVLSVVSRQSDVCKDKPAATSPAETPIGSFLTPAMQVVFFAGCCYVCDIHKIITPGGHTYDKGQFDIMMGNMCFVMDEQGVKVSKSAWDAFTNSQAIRHPRAHTSAFRPDKAVGEVWQDGNQDVVNSYHPITTPRKRGNPAPFLQHLEKILPVKRDRDHILAYMAAILQHPGIKFQWAPLIQGTRGNGKSLLSRVMIEAVGRVHCHSPGSAEITGKFNDWIENKILICCEDIYVPHERQEVLEAIKPMITSDWLEIEGKGKAKVSRYVCANFILNSNHKDALKYTEDNRGLAVFYCAQQTVADLQRDGMSGDYFPKLYNWLKGDGYAIVADYLAEYPIPDAMNPATSCHRGPATSSTTEAIRESLGNLEQEIVEAIAADKTGFRGGWISSHYLDALIRDCGIRIARNKRTQAIEALGYVSLGRAHNPVQPDGAKPVLYVLTGHDALALRPAEAARLYSEAQASGLPFLKVA